MYHANESRYETMKYHRCGDSGLMLPEVSLGFWHNFGDTGVYENMRQMCFTAFDHGITHFDLANNYGPQPGSAEENLGKILREELSSYRDELIISSKAGFDMWPGPYGNWGSRKYLLASLDRSLQRMGLDYVDIFYHHRMDPNTPLEETGFYANYYVVEAPVLKALEVFGEPHRENPQRGYPRKAEEADASSAYLGNPSRPARQPACPATCSIIRLISSSSPRK